jgi:glycerophosphoryl diester phosphodiesterase
MIWLERALMGLLNLWFALLPRRQPAREVLQDCKIISHRGEHDNRRVRENTLAAFDASAEAGCWGLELDVRWTRDLQPVVMHDADAQRVFGSDLVIAEVSLRELQQRIPEIPTLRQIVERFGGRQHLMVELKRDELGHTEERAACLQEVFAALQPVTDYHFLALQPEMFNLAGFTGERAWVPVAEFNVGEISRVAAAHDYGGVCGQYLLITAALIERHHACGQQLGTGFAASRFSLFRELNRGVDWIFTNHALRLEAIRRQLLRSA